MAEALIARQMREADLTEDEMERQLVALEQRLGSLEEMLARRATMPGRAERAPDSEAEIINGPISDLLLAVRREVARNLCGTDPEGQEGDELARRFSELDDVLAGLFARLGAGISQ